MNQVLIELNLPDDWKMLRFPRALDSRLQELLDRQDRGERLTADERAQAEALCELVEMLALLKLRAARAAQTAKK